MSILNIKIDNFNSACIVNDNKSIYITGIEYKSWREIADIYNRLDGIYSTYYGNNGEKISVKKNLITFISWYKWVYTGEKTGSILDEIVNTMTPEKL
jgi:hypothetical protein